MKSYLWLKFYPKDWNGDYQLRTCSLASRGLLISLLEPMHRAEPYGHLLIDGETPTHEHLAIVATCKSREVKYGLEELVKAGVLSMRNDGVLFSRRMVRDGEKLAKAKADGSRGGHPKLKQEYNLPGYVYVIERSDDGAVKIGISKDPNRRITRIRGQFPGQTLTLLDTAHVSNMGAAEHGLHAHFRKEGQYGEWFALNPEERRRLTDLMQTLKGAQKVEPAPIEARSQKPEARSVAKEQQRATTEPSPVRGFLKWFEGAFQKHRGGARYFVNWEKDSSLVKRLFTLHSEARLKDHAVILLTATDDDFINGSDRGIGILSAKINWLEDRLTAWEAKHGKRASGHAS